MFKQRGGGGELCLGLRVSLLTANWHPAQTNKVHHPDPPVTACTVRLPSGDQHSWKAAGGKDESPSVCLLLGWRAAPQHSKWFGHGDWSKMIMARPVKLVINYCHKSLVMLCYLLWLTTPVKRNKSNNEVMLLQEGQISDRAAVQRPQEVKYTSVWST